MQSRTYPRHPSLARLLEAIRPSGISGHSALAKAMGVSPQTITNWASRGVPPDAAVKAGEMFNISPLWITMGTDPSLPGNHQPYVPEEVARLSAPQESADVRYLARLLDAIPAERRQLAYVTATQVLIGFLDVAGKNPTNPAPALHQPAASTSA